MSSTVLSEPGLGGPNDPRLTSLASLADAADALVMVATTLAAAARAAVEAFSAPIPASSGIQGSDGINLGKGADDIHGQLVGDKFNTSQRPGPGVVGTGGEDYATSHKKPLPATTDILKSSPGNSNRETQPYRLLVDTEADVLLFVCALIDRRQRAICYMPFEPGPLNTYKQLIERVTESSVHILASLEPTKRDQFCSEFLQNDGSVLLIPESLSPELEMQGENSWVIHAGWPSSATQYTAQRRNHMAQNNIIVAYSGDQSLYPSGESVVGLTETWPKDGTSFRESVSISRPLYEVILSEIPLEMKSDVYQDWMQSHGIHGSRHIKAWTPSMMVQRANAYLSEVLLWSGPHTGGDIPLPEVSQGFVSQNELEPAVLEGILRVETDLDSPLPSPSAIPRPDSTTTQSDFQHTIGHTYFVLDEEFDAIPLMCYIAEKYGKVICFLEGHVALRYYQKLFSKVTGLPVIASVSNNAQTTEEPALAFLSSASPAILLLTYTTINLPAALKQGAIDCCIYWGLNSPLKQAKKHRPLINCETTIAIIPKAQQNWLHGANDIRKHPSAALPLDLTENSTLAPVRDKMKAALASDTMVIRELYTNRVYGVGAIPRTSLSAEEAARRANQYAARILLHGDVSDGSEKFPPIAGRPPVPRIAVEKFKLQPAVEAGLLTVVG